MEAERLGKQYHEVVKHLLRTKATASIGYSSEAARRGCAPAVDASSIETCRCYDCQPSARLARIIGCEIDILKLRH